MSDNQFISYKYLKVLERNIGLKLAEYNTHDLPLSSFKL